VEVVKTGATGAQTALTPIYVTGNTGKIQRYTATPTKAPASGVPSN
jgi:hypothetical protein